MSNGPFCGRKALRDSQQAKGFLLQNVIRSLFFRLVFNNQPIFYCFGGALRQLRHKATLRRCRLNRRLQSRDLRRRGADIKRGSTSRCPAALSACPASVSYPAPDPVSEGSSKERITPSGSAERISRKKRASTSCCPSVPSSPGWALERSILSSLPAVG